MSGTYYVYILANKPRGTLYIGVTNNLIARVWQHKQATVPSFTQKYGVSRLVWFDETNDVAAAIQREKQLKKWRRLWKIELVEQTNPEWRDLSEEWYDKNGFPRSRE